MVQILNFPTKRIAPIGVRSGHKHHVTVKILDTIRPRRTRWRLQFEIQEVAGFDALKGFTDRAVAAGCLHHFDVNSTRAAHQFVAETSDLVADGKVAIWIGGVRVQPRVTRSA